MFKIAILLAIFCIALTYNTQGNVLKLTNDDFDTALNEFPALFVKFFAPWCGHCKNLAPIYSEVADALNAENSAIKIATVDCTVQKTICQRYNIRGYPTVNFFKNGGQPEKYSDARNKEAMINWLKQRSVDLQVSKGSQNQYKKEEDLYILTVDTYHNALAQFDYVLVKFFAPWCGHCKNMAPAYLAAAKNLAAKSSKAIIAEVDCTVEKEVCSSNGIRGYPTLKMFVRGHESPIDFKGSRSEEGIVEWVESTMASNTPIEVKEEEAQEAEEL